MKASKDDQAIVFRRGDQVALRYLYAGVPYKPYVSEFATPSGVNILRDAPSDHLHHHGLMFAITIDGVNFWEEAKAPGTEKTREISQPQLDAETGAMAFRETLDWIGPEGGKVLAVEERMIALDTTLESVSLLSWWSTFSLPAGEDSANLTGTHYHGLGMRFLESMDKGDGFLNSEGGKGVEGTNDKRGLWCAYSANADGKPVTVACFDHPKNLRHPATWFSMNTPFSYISATLNLSKEPYELKGKEKLRLRYGVALWDGEAGAEQIGKVYEQWIKLYP